MPKNCPSKYSAHYEYVPAISISQNLRLRVINSVFAGNACNSLQRSGGGGGVWAALCRSVLVGDLAASQDGLEQRGSHCATTKKRKLLVNFSIKQYGHYVYHLLELSKKMRTLCFLSSSL
jgi:hypothetical protein